MRPIDASPGEPLHCPRVAPAPFDGRLHDRLQWYRATEPARFEALNDLAAFNPVEIRLIETGHGETGTRGEPPRSGSRTKRRAVIEVASTALSSNLNSRGAADISETV
jgi:hypothetical protein